MKKSKKEMQELRENLTAYPRGSREEEMEDHNGKPFTSHNTPTPKTKYNRKKMTRVERDDY